jgi:lipoyl(octanoyl) transferase
MTKQFTFEEKIQKTITYCNLGLMPYSDAWELQKTLYQMRLEKKISDILLLLEHPNTYTLGKSANEKNIIGSEEFLRKWDFKIFNIDRGGDVTYHGPGQIVGYLIFDLNDWQHDSHKYLRLIEESIIQTCEKYNLATGRKEKYTGVWIEERKICAIGVKISRWITMHGFALNVNTNLNLFKGIIPCGINDKDVTSLERELNRKFDIEQVKIELSEQIKNLFQFDEVNEISKNELFDRINGEKK